ncbi:MAG: exodeoxyribonuclease VII large subunit [Spirochaetes bacterium]|nr:exodeoxyribonuclease VII large subunit [Spirochaetota bacterium]
MDDVKVLKVSELTELVKSLVEDGFPSVRVEGEISNFRPAPSGHLYFTLKDRTAMIQAVMFRGKAARLGFDPADGALVKVSGSLSVYAARGQYQLICESMERSGVGDILALLEERKRALAAEGLFDEARKRPLPRFPERIAVITSPTGAAIRDILNVLGRRNSSVNVVILPATVQGEDAPAEIVRQIETANLHGLGDVLIVGRGGGSIEDLLAFSDEGVVRAVAASRIPVISAVGHEIDWALTDFAADVRAPTPSAAAELVSESTESALAGISRVHETIERTMRSRLERAWNLTSQFSVEGLELRFRRVIQPVLQRFDDAKERLIDCIRNGIRDASRRLELAERDIETANPSAVLSRGFAVVTRLKDGKVVRDASCARSGEKVRIRFAKGASLATIEESAHEEV